MPQPDRAALTQPFAEEEIRQFEGRGGKTMTYIEDETVMDRLDAAFGVGGWQVLVEAVPVYEGVVKVRLGIRVAEEWTWYEDFGYPNQAGGDVLKEAVSDGIRRCGRYLGIARDLYRKRTYETPVVHRSGQSAPVPLRAVAAPPRSSTAVPDDLDDLDFDALSPTPPGAVAVARAEGQMTTKELMDRADSLHVPVKVLGDTSKRMFGHKFWKLTELTPEQRWGVAVEVGLL